MLIHVYITTKKHPNREIPKEAFSFVKFYKEVILCLTHEQHVELRIL